VNFFNWKDKSETP